MQGDRETKENPAAVIGLLFFCQFLKSLGTSLSFQLSLVSPPLSPSLFHPAFFCSFFQFPPLPHLCAKNIFIILRRCPHSDVPQHTNASVCVCVCESHTISVCFYLCVSGVNACENKSAFVACVSPVHMCGCMCAMHARLCV